MTKTSKTVAILIATMLQALLLVACSQKNEPQKDNEIGEKMSANSDLRSVDIATAISNGNFDLSDFKALAEVIQTNAEIGKRQTTN